VLNLTPALTLRPMAKLIGSYFYFLNSYENKVKTRIKCDKILYFIKIMKYDTTKNMKICEYNNNKIKCKYVYLK